MDLSKLSKESLIELNKQIKKALINKEKYVLKLKIDNDGDFNDGDLLIYYINENNIVKPLGWLSIHTGTTKILKDSSYYFNYEEWRDKGMKFDTNIIEWLGGKYQLYYSKFSGLKLIRTDIPNGDIYNFNICETIPYCEDTNLLRFKHNNKPY